MIQIFLDIQHQTNIIIVSKKLCERKVNIKILVRTSIELQKMWTRYEPHVEWNLSSQRKPNNINTKSGVIFCDFQPLIDKIAFQLKSRNICSTFALAVNHHMQMGSIASIVSFWTSDAGWIWKQAYSLFQKPASTRYDFIRWRFLNDNNCDPHLNFESRTIG